MTTLKRSLGLTDAIMIGLAAMIGSGVFSALGPAASLAGPYLILSVCIAGLAASFNASSMARLSAAIPQAGGGYIYGRKLLSHGTGFMAGWCFVCGKSISCSAMALTAGHYLVPQHPKETAFIILLSLTLVNLRGIQKTAFLSKLITLFVIAILLLVIGLVFSSEPNAYPTLLYPNKVSISGILGAASIMFFAFAGYARIATLGEEVMQPKQTIPKAIMIALSIVLALYIFLAIGLSRVLTPELLSKSQAPLATAVSALGHETFSRIVRLTAGIGSIGVLVSLLVGVSRTLFAMARHQDIPMLFSRLDQKHQVPYIAEITVAVLVALCILFLDIGSAIALSSFNILTYYAIANLSALKVSKEHWYQSNILSFLGLLTCFVLVFNLPKDSLILGILLAGFGLTFYCLRKKYISLTKQHENE